MYRPLPHTGYERPHDTETTYGHIRTSLEAITNADPYEQIDGMTYNIVHGWANRADYKPIVIEVLKRRLKQGRVSADKAVLLAQSVPLDAIGPLSDGLKAKAKPKEGEPETFIHHIASNLLAASTAISDAAKEKTAKDKYEAWCSVYGRPADGFEWRPLPQEVEWGMWGLVWVPPEEWWKAPEEVKKE